MVHFKSVTLTLDRDYDEEEVDELLDALEKFGFVIDATPEPATSQDHIARQRVREELLNDILEVLRG